FDPSPSSIASVKLIPPAVYPWLSQRTAGTFARRPRVYALQQDHRDNRTCRFRRGRETRLQLGEPLLRLAELGHRPRPDHASRRQLFPKAVLLGQSAMELTRFGGVCLGKEREGGERCRGPMHLTQRSTGGG